jgi:hypothetical protein
MNKRAKTFWLPALVSLTGSMAWRMMVQRLFSFSSQASSLRQSSFSSPQSPRLLNHAGLPLSYQLLWLAVLPLFGAASAYLSRRAGGSRSAGLTAAVFPSMVMILLWMGLATRMSHPSAGQWFGLLCGVLNWSVTPGISLLLGAWFVLRVRSANGAGENMNMRTVDTRTINMRTRTFWLPGLVSLTAAMACLTLSTLGGREARFVARGWATYVVYIPWLLTLPLCGAAGAYLSRRAGGERGACLAAGLFPVMAMTSLVGFLTLIGEFVFARPQAFYFSVGLLFGVILPGVALLLGAMPFAKAIRRSEGLASRP